MAYRTLIDDLHEGLRVRGWTDVRPAFGFVLLAARERPTTATALAVLMGTTKQAASKLVDAMATAGYVVRATDAADARQRVVELTLRGKALLATVEDVYVELEQGWAEVIGAPRVERLRHDLTCVLMERHGGELPPVRPTW
jgi:DNA-binding MarR family transcriptional regulator